MAQTENGYFTLSSTGDPIYHFYLKDHQGNNRVVVSQSGSVEQINHYYPYGALFAESTNGDVQRFKYNGKELDRKFGLNWYDHGARHNDAAIGRWISMDPMAEKYYGISPYAYCGGDPVNKMDNTGLFPDSTRAVVAQQINEVINNTWFGSGSTGVVRKLEDAENYKARDENSYYVMNCEYNEDTGEYVATAEFTMDKTPITIAGYASTAIEIAGYAMFLSPETACYAQSVVTLGDKLGDLCCVADQFTNYVNGDLSVLSFTVATSLKAASSATKKIINNYFPSYGFSSVNNEINNILKIIDSMYSAAVGNIPDVIIEEKKK